MHIPASKGHPRIYCRKSAARITMKGYDIVIGAVYVTCKCVFFLLKKKKKQKKSKRSENFCAELAIFDGEREVAVTLTIIVLINSNNN